MAVCFILHSDFNMDTKALTYNFLMLIWLVVLRIEHLYGGGTGWYESLKHAESVKWKSKLGMSR